MVNFKLQLHLLWYDVVNVGGGAEWWPWPAKAQTNKRKNTPKNVINSGGKTSAKKKVLKSISEQPAVSLALLSSAILLTATLISTFFPFRLWFISRHGNRSDLRPLRVKHTHSVYRTLIDGKMARGPLNPHSGTSDPLFLGCFLLMFSLMFSFRRRRYYSVPAVALWTLSSLDPVDPQ